MYVSSFHDKVVVIPYQEAWTQRFQAMKERLEDILMKANIECDVWHVGGTAIPGMCSKPIVDVLVTVDDEDMEIAPHALAREFYCLGECGRPGRYFFSDGDTEDDAVYIHLTTADNQVARDQLKLKDILLACPDKRAEYAALKHRLAGQYPHSRATYRLMKGAFIEKCLEEGYDMQGN